MPNLHLPESAWEWALLIALIAAFNLIWFLRPGRWTFTSWSDALYVAVFVGLGVFAIGFALATGAWQPFTIGLFCLAVAVWLGRDVKRELRKHRMHTVRVVNAFTQSPDGGNPAGVMILNEPMLDSTMQAIATAMGLAETAYVIPEGDGRRIRWFTPTTEVPLCGHATLASAHELWATGQSGEGVIVFESASGPLRASRGDGGWITLDFPADPPTPIEEPEGLADALGVPVEDWLTCRLCTVAVLSHHATVRAAKPDIPRLEELGHGEVLITAPGEGEHDFVSRFFAPGAGIPEDPVTGSAHCVLAPLWIERLGRQPLIGFQASARGGTVRVDWMGDRVLLSGQALSVESRVIDL